MRLAGARTHFRGEMMVGKMLIFGLMVGMLSSLSRRGAASDDEWASRTKVNKELKVTSQTRSGAWSVSLAWVSIEMIVDYWEALRGVVEFSPNSNAAQCSSISFIQTAKVADNDGEDYHWPLAEAPRNEMKTLASFGVEGGFYIDHKAADCWKGARCSPYYRDHWPNTEDGSRDGRKDPDSSRAAVLVDYPHGWEFISAISLEACAFCRDNDTPLSCFQWGGRWGMIGEPEFLVEGSTEKPTVTFQEALARFEGYYSPSGK